MLFKTNKFTKYNCLAVVLLLFGFGAFAQKDVSGRVVNSSDNQPIAGATIQVRGTETITQSQNDGAFSIRVPNDNSVLVITVVGFARMELAVAGKNNLGNISLSPASASLNEVVVTGYVAQRKKDITGSVAVVNVQNLKAVPSGTIESLLQGQASGVTVINSGAPGSPSNVRIRGITSTGSTDPLVVIDGTPGNMHDLNVNDIQSIQVLKDAGAAAIYGVRGSNGVIVITTKKGRTGKPLVSYDAYIGTQRPLKDGWNLANPTENANAIWEQYKNTGVAPLHKQYGSGPTPVIPDYITPFGTMEGAPNTDPATYALYTNQITKANKQGTDWFHEIFKPALVQSHNLSVSGGGEKSTYLFSLNYHDQDGTLIHNYLKRYSARINSTFNIRDNIRVGENAFFFYKRNPGYLGLPGVNNGNSINYAYRMPAIVPVYDIRGNFAGGGSQSLGNASNPVAVMARTKDNRGNNWQVMGNVFAEMDIAKNFTLRSSFGGSVDFFNSYSFVFTAYEAAENSQNPNSFIENYGYNSSRTWTNTLNYKNIFDKHSVNVLVGSEAIRNYGRAAASSRGSYYVTNLNNLTVDPNLWTLNFGSSTSQSNSNLVLNGAQSPYENTLLSFFGRVDYAYNDRYLLSATLRRDGSSLFAKEQQWGYFPSVTAGWRISQEDFMKNVPWLNDLKLRGGWGKLGSINNIVNIAPYNAFTTFASNAVYSWYDINGTSTSPTQGLYTAQYGNPFTTWEEDVVTNIGLDATILRNKLELSIEWYKKEINGLLFTPAAPGTVIGSAIAPFQNFGDIENKGVDLSAVYHGKIGKDFSFDITGTFTSYNNQVVGVPGPTNYRDFGNSRLQVGHPMGSFFGYKVLGIFQSAAEVANSPTQDQAKAGRFRYADVNGDKVINSNDRTHFGDPNPDFTAGLNINAAYKNFDISMFFYANVGNDVINQVRASIDFPQQFDVAISKDAVYNSWRPDRPNAKVPILERSANFSNIAVFNSYLMEDGSFLRCKNLSLGYTIPANKFTRLGISRFRVYVQALNLFTITDYTGLDPEFPGSTLSSTNFGVDGGVYPANQPMYTFGVNLSF
jgi:TonB-linked SusC/RagA family outer membrane protein